jgi:ribA/ribD-fused uncharacterized protein
MIEQDGSFVEREFQAAKYEGHPIRQAIVRRTATPRQAKKLGRLWRLTDDELAAWNDRRVDVMLSLVDKKVDDWPELGLILIGSGQREIVEINKHHDNFWGDCICGRPACAKPGQNWLGETWMLIRRRLREDATRSPSTR